MEAQYRDEPPWYLQVGEDFSKKSADRIASEISKDFLKNGELAGGLATVAAVVPVVGQIVAIAATCVSIAQMISSQQKLGYLQAYVRSSQQLNALYQGDLDEEVIAGGIELEMLREELEFVRTVQSAYRKTIFISAGLVLTAMTILIIKANKK
jgi:hypothetical protein